MQFFQLNRLTPVTSAPLFLASSILSASHKTAIFCFLPDPFGNLTVVLKLKSPPFDYFKFIFKDNIYRLIKFSIRIFLN